MELLLPSFALIIWGFFSLLILLLHLVALISLLRSEFRDNINKLIWIVVILMVPFFGPVLYFLIGRNQRIKPI